MAGPLRLTPALVLAAAAAGAAPAQERWAQVRTPHFLVVSDAAPSDARRVGLRLERFRAVARQLFDPAAVADTTPVTVLLFRNARSMRPVLPLQGGRAWSAAGIFVKGHDRHYMALDAQAEERAFGTLLHEYVHLLNSRASPPLPLWMDEGLAETYRTAEIDDRRVVLGAPVAEHLERLRTSRPLPLDELLAVDARWPHHHDEHGRGLFYAQSWALVRYLLLGGTGQPQPLRAYLAAVAGGRKPAEAARAAWGRDLAALEKELRRYVRGENFVGLRVPVASLSDADVHEAMLGPAEAAFHKGDYLVHDGRLAEARPHLEAAIALDPARPGPYRSLGLGHYHAREYREALRWLEAAVERDPDDGVARYFRARALLEAAGGSVGPALAAAVREDLRVAAARAPALADAPQLLSQVERLLASPAP